MEGMSTMFTVVSSDHETLDGKGIFSIFYLV